MYRYFTHTESYNYTEELQKFADSYNKGYHRTRLLKATKPTCGGKCIGLNNFQPRVKARQYEILSALTYEIKSASHIYGIYLQDNTTKMNW